MLLYILLPVAAVGFGIPLCRSKAGRAVYCACFGLIFFVIAAVRYTVGHDYILYANWYNRLLISSIDELTYWSREKGFLIPLKMLADCGLPYQTMFVLIAFFVALGVMLYIYKKSTLPWVSVTAFVSMGLYFISMNFMRQFLAAILITLAFRYIYERHLLRFFAVVMLASVFHFTALVILPFYFILRIPVNKLGFFILTPLAFVSYIFSAPIIEFITGFFYTGYDLDLSVEMSTGLSPVYTIAMALLLLLALLLRKMLIARDPRNDYFITALYFAVYFSFIGTSHGIVARIGLFFMLPAVLILSAEIFITLRQLFTLTFRRMDKRRYIYAGLICAVFIGLAGGFYGFLLAGNYNGVVPYQTIFSNEEVADV